MTNLVLSIRADIWKDTIMAGDTRTSLTFQRKPGERDLELLLRVVKPFREKISGWGDLSTLNEVIRKTKSGGWVYALTHNEGKR